MPQEEIAGLDAWALAIAYALTAMVPFALSFASVPFAQSDLGGAGYVDAQVEWFLHLNGFLSIWPGFWSGVTELGDATVLLPFLALVGWRPRLWAALVGAIPLTVLCIRCSASDCSTCRDRPRYWLPIGSPSSERS